MASASSPIHLAVIDDYLDVGAPYFQSLPVTVTKFSDTLDANTPSGLAALKERLQPYTIISSIRERTAFPAALLKSLPNLKLLLNAGTRNASIDGATAKKLGITVTGTTGQPAPGSNAKPPPNAYSSTAQQALSLLLALSSRIPFDNAKLQQDPGFWQSGFAVALAGQTLGVIGLGHLGTIFARMAILGLGMKVIAWSPNLTQEKAEEAAKKEGLPEGSFQVVTKDELLGEADVVSLHMVLSDRTRGLLKKDDLAKMKKEAFLINTSRGGLIDEDALYEALDKGTIKGVGLDVFWKEPLPADSKWRSTKWGEEGRSLVVLSPHMGYVNEQTIKRWYEEQAEEVKRWLKGQDPKVPLN